MKQLILLVTSLLFLTVARAHTSSTAYLEIDSTGPASMLVYRLALRDADALLDLDRNADGMLTWGEVDDRRADLDALVRRALAVRADGRQCTLDFERPAYVPNSANGDGGFVLLRAPLECVGSSTALTIDYHLFEGIDASHRALLRAAAGSPVLLEPGSRTLVSLAHGGKSANPAGLLAQGITHIFGGLDHLLFLIALMLPAVQTRANGAWQARRDLRSALVQVAWIATAFTVAHSITLALASFGIIRIATEVIEPLIALTVLLAALNNLWPVVRRRLAWVAFAFGLVHGFGFAEVLVPLQLPPMQLVTALFAFNFGVEIGQLIVVGVSFAFLATVRLWSGYARWILGAGSTAVAIMASVWIGERVFGTQIIGFFGLA